MKIFIRVARVLYGAVFKHIPVLFSGMLLFSIIHGLSHGVITMVTARFFDAASRVVTGENALRTLVPSILVLAGVTLAREVLNGLDNYNMGIVSERLRRIFSVRLFEKCGRIDPVRFEDTAFLDNLDKARKGASMGLTGFIYTVSNLFSFYLPYFLFMGWYLYRQDPILALSLVLVFIPVMINQFIRIKVFNQLEDEAAPLRRLSEHLNDCVTDRGYYKETRLLGAYDYFRTHYLESLGKLIHKERRAEGRTGLWETVMKLINLAGQFGILYLMINSLIQGRITAGAFSAVFASMGRLYSIMEEIISRRIGRLAKAMGVIVNYVDFFDTPERQGREKLPGGGDIVLQNVRFRYSGAEKEALKGINLTIRPGETLALVGRNGSGKTTLVRLIVGLYLPEKGAVLRNGIATDQIQPDELFRDVSAVFQKFQRYKMTLGDNLGLGDISTWSEGEIPKPDKGRLAAAREKAGVDRDDEALLSREFGGEDLSGGEWQRVAIGRGYYRDRSLIILDEPTAAIDPLEEKAVFDRFADLARDKTALVVTHRLGSVRRADRIVVLEEGLVAETGSHEELLAAGGAYAEMFREQAGWYERESN